MFVDCPEICISITVKHVQHVRIIRAFVCLGGLTKFSVPGGQKILLDCGLLGGISTQADTMWYAGSTNGRNYNFKPFTLPS